jgi:3-hydroxybutyryl-CoA dehydratase
MSEGTVAATTGSPMHESAPGYAFEDLTVGMTAVYGKTVTEADILLFAGFSGDTNPVHLNQEYAATTMFKGRIAHGMLSAGFISTVLGTRLPGPGCIYVSQSLRFKAPVRAGDTVYARATVSKLIAEKRMVELKTVCTVGDKVVIDGEATVLIPASKN